MTKYLLLTLLTISTVAFAHNEQTNTYKEDCQQIVNVLNGYVPYYPVDIFINAKNSDKIILGLKKVGVEFILIQKMNNGIEHIQFSWNGKIKHEGK